MALGLIQKVRDASGSMRFGGRGAGFVLAFFIVLNASIQSFRNDTSTPMVRQTDLCTREYSAQIRRISTSSTMSR